MERCCVVAVVPHEQLVAVPGSAAVPVLTRAQTAGDFSLRLATTRPPVACLPLDLCLLVFLDFVLGYLAHSEKTAP